MLLVNRFGSSFKADPKYADFVPENYVSIIMLCRVAAERGCPKIAFGCGDFYNGIFNRRDAMSTVCIRMLSLRSSCLCGLDVFI